MKTKTHYGNDLHLPNAPEVITDKPGKCPKCGMDLVVKIETQK